MDMRKIFFIVIVLTLSTLPLMAEDIEELKAQIQVLQNRVNELEAERNQPTKRQWDPFSQMQRLQEEMNQMFEGFNVGNVTHTTRQSSLSLNLEDQGDQYVLTIDTKGLDKEKLDIDIDSWFIRISGEYSSDTQEENPYGRLHRRSYSHFANSISVPSDANMDLMEMERKEDQLILTIPKK